MGALMEGPGAGTHGRGSSPKALTWLSLSLRICDLHGHSKTPKSADSSKDCILETKAQSCLLHCG